LVNKTGITIHHTIKPALFFALAFILNERAPPMVNRWFARYPRGLCAMRAREPAVKLIGLHQHID
jgi:hypothetical protein